MAHQMSGPLRRHHENIDVLRRLDEPEMDSKSVRKSEILTGLHGRCDFTFVHARRKFVGNQNHDNLALFRGLPHGQHAEPGLLRLRDGSTCALQSDHNVSARIMACACPCDPNPITAIFLFWMYFKSASLS